MGQSSVFAEGSFEQTYRSFELVDAVMITGFGAMVYYGYKFGQPNQPFFHRLKQGLRIDGWHTFHLAQGIVYGMFRTQDAVRDWLWFHGFPEWFANPSDNLIVFENFMIALLWEYVEWKAEPRPYDEVYGSWENARFNNIMDVVISCFGVYALTDLPWIKNILFFGGNRIEMTNLRVRENGFNLNLQIRT